MTVELSETDVLLRLRALSPGRHLVALAGAPASGKSTLADTLADGLNADQPGRAAVLPMDGYHYDDAVLEARGHRARKGAPHTYDVGGLRHMLGRLRDNAETEIATPVFDRAIEVARAGAFILHQSVEIIIVEGNYVLLEDAPWDGLAPFFDLTISFDVPEGVLRQRLIARWEGYNLTPAQIDDKLELNDLPNGRIVRTRSRAPDIRISAG